MAADGDNSTASVPNNFAFFSAITYNVCSQPQQIITNRINQSMYNNIYAMLLFFILHIRSLWKR